MNDQETGEELRGPQDPGERQRNLPSSILDSQASMMWPGGLQVITVGYTFTSITDKILVG
jgi:hypothetical protein